MPRVFWSAEDELWIAVDDFRPGCSAAGMNEVEAKAELFDAATAWDEGQRAAGNLPSKVGILGRNIGNILLTIAFTVTVIALTQCGFEVKFK